MKAFIITTDETSFAVDAQITLDWLQKTVGGYIEIFSGRPGWHGYCNEEGKLLGLPVNVLATAFAKALGWPGNDVLVGDVVFLGNGPDGGEADVPQWLLEDFQFYLGA